MQIVYKFKLCPSKEQEKLLQNTLDICRELYNYMKGLRERYYYNYKYSMSYNEQSKILTFLKTTEEWKSLKNIHSQVLQDVLKRLDNAYKRFFQGISGYPKFKGYRHYNSFTFPQVKTMRNPFEKKGFLLIPKIGFVKMKIHRGFNPEKVSTMVIKREINKWYVCLTCEIEELDILDKSTSSIKAIGIDLGINHFLALSDGTFVENPKYLRKSEARLKLLQRRLSRKEFGSNNREKARKQLVKLHRKIKNQRRDFLHKVSKFLTDTYDLIVTEALNIKNMVKNHHLAKSISDAGWGILLNYISYKAKLKGKKHEMVNPNGTSQECICGAKVAKDLSVRVHICPNCGIVEDRDTMSARIILKRGQLALA